MRGAPFCIAMVGMPSGPGALYGAIFCRADSIWVLEMGGGSGSRFSLGVWSNVGRTAGFGGKKDLASSLALSSLVVAMAGLIGLAGSCIVSEGIMVECCVNGLV